jgi:hypothetical protein
VKGLRSILSMLSMASLMPDRNAARASVIDRILRPAPKVEDKATTLRSRHHSGGSTPMTTRMMQAAIHAPDRLIEILPPGAAPHGQDGHRGANRTAGYEDLYRHAAPFAPGGAAKQTTGENMLKLKRLLCKLLHAPEDMMHPFRGVVRCRRCHCEFPVTWGKVPKPRPVLPVTEPAEACR